MSSRTSPVQPGSTVGRFAVSSVLGRGAMGTVFLAHDPQIDRAVAIKTVTTSGPGNVSEIETRFLKEARLAGRLQHPNVVTIFEAGQDRGVLYMAMEYVDGEPLDRYIAGGRPISMAERLDIVRQVALALEHAHQRGVIHRDVKPGNILVTRDGQVKVADFGIGKLLSDGADLTRTGQMVGSPAYMSPEQVRGEKLDGRSDFFSLGVVLYELLTGARPFPGDSITTLVYQILHTEPRDPLQLRAELPDAARAIFTRLLAKSREERPSNAADFLRELERLRSAAADRPTVPTSGVRAGPKGTPVRPPPEASPRPVTGLVASAPPSWRDSRRSYLLGGVAAVLAAAALILAVSRGAGRRRAEVLASANATAAPTTAAGSAAAPAANLASADGDESARDAAARPAVATRSRAARPAARENGLEAVPGGSRSAERVYRTRRAVKFGVSPDQARIYVDGRYVGIADDWDDHGGGKTLELRGGPHRIRLSLPGYRTLTLDVIRTPAAREDTVDVGDSLKKESNVSYPHIPRLDERTVGPVEFRVDPPDAVVSEGRRVLGRASSFGPSSPLTLSGPKVHDLVLSAAGHKPKTVRILVAPNAESDRAAVKVELKRN